MIPDPYDKITDFEDIELVCTISADSYRKVPEELQHLKGRFTSLRIDRNTLPEGLYAYDIRHDDESTGDMVTLEPFVWVNHYGTFVTDRQLDLSRWGWLIDSYNFI